MNRGVLFLIIVLVGLNPALHAQPTTQAGQSLDLLVVNQDNQPIAGSKVFISGNGDEVITSTGSDGRMAVPFPNRPTDYLRVHVEADGFVDKEAMWNVYSLGQDGPQRYPIPASYTLRMQPGIHIGGKVVDDAGQPVAGAGVAFFIYKKLDDPRERLSGQEIVTTSQDGTWSFSGAPAEEDALEIGVWDSRYATDGFYELKKFPLQQLRDGSIALTLERGVAIEGLVNGPDGKPLAGAQVRAGGGIASNRIPSQKTGADGRFLYTAKAGTAFILTITAKGCAPELKSVMTGKSGQQLTIQLAKSVPLRGQVVDADGKPVPQAWVYTGNWRGSRALDMRLHADEQGKFVWNDAPADAVQYDIDATSSGFLREQNVPLVAGEKEIKVTVRRALHVSGTVVDGQTNQPITDFHVVPGISFSPQRAIYWVRNGSQAKPHDGKFDYSENMARPGYAVRIEADGYLPAESRVFTADEGAVNFEFKLERGNDLALVVLKPDGNPARGATGMIATAGQMVILSYEEKKIYSQGGQKATADADGHLKFSAQTGPFKLVVFGDDGYAEANQDTLANSHEITLQAWSRVEGRLMIGKQPATLQEVAVGVGNMVSPASKQPSIMHEIQGKTDADGHFAFDRIPPGVVTVARQVNEPMGGGMIAATRTQRQKLNLQPGQTAHVTLGGVGRPIVGHVTIPQTLAERRDWFFVECEISTKMEAFPPLPMPDEVKNGSPEQKEKWNDDFAKTQAGKEYLATLQKIRDTYRSYPLQVARDGTFRIDDVTAGTYELALGVSNGEPGNGDTIAAGSSEFTVPDDQNDAPVELPTLQLEMFKTVQIGQAAPDFSAQTLDGKDLKLSDFHGKYVLLDFWATWCGPCLEEMPNIKAAYQAFKDNDRVAMISLSMDENADKPKDYAQKNGMAWTQVFQKGGWQAPIVKDYGVRSIPSVWLIGPDGNVVAKNLRGAEANAMLATLLSK